MTLFPQTHPFMEYLNDKISPLIDELKDYDEKNLEEFRETSLQENYLRDCFLSLASVLNVCIQLEHTAKLLSGYRNQHTPDNYSRLDHVIYHLENHSIRIIMISDRILLLINCIFRIGLLEKDCKESTIINNLRVRDTPVREDYRQLEKYIQPFRKQRNIIIHRGKYDDPNIEHLTPLYRLQNSDIDLPKNVNHYIKRISDQTISQKQQELTDVNQEIFTLLSKILNSLQQEFMIQYENLDISGMIEKKFVEIATKKRQELEKQENK